MPSPVYAQLRGPSGWDARALVLMASGWVQTEMGGSNATLTIDDSVSNLVNVLLRQQGKPGLEYLGRTVPW